MSVPLPDPSADNPVFGSTKREILLILKREGQIDLQTLAQHLGISKMAVHKHARELVRFLRRFLLGIEQRHGALWRFGP